MSLILVLVTLTVFGLIVPVLGQFGSVNGISGYLVKGQRYDRYAADNGMNATIAWATARRTAGRERVACPDIETHVDGPTVASERDVRVECTGYQDSGKPLGSATTPAYAVLGLDPGTHSIDVDSTGRLKTHGAWWADGAAGSTSADIHRVFIDATEDLFGATGGCRPSQGAQIFAAPQRCDSGIRVGDPGYNVHLQTLDPLPADPPYDPSSCEGVASNHVIALAAGIHWNVDWLKHVTDGSCGDVVVWLEPGQHYFDFDFYDTSADSEWIIGDSRNPVTVVGGTPKGWIPNGGGNQAVQARGAVSQANNAADAGACDLSGPGVRVVLGSKSQLTMRESTQIELCPIVPDASSQQIAIYGPPSGGTAGADAITASTPTAAVPNGAGFSWPATPPPPSVESRLASPECDRDPCDPTAFIEGTLDGGRRDASVRMQVPNRLTPHDRINQLVLSVSHREQENDGNGNSNDRDRIQNLTFTIEGLGTPVTCDRLPQRSDWTVDTVRCSLARGIPAPDSVDVPNFQVNYALRTNGGDTGSVTVQLDRVAIEGSETPVTVRQQKCDCDVVGIDGSGAGSAFVWGTVYTPTADLHTDFGGRTRFKFARGVIVRSLVVERLPNDPTFAPFVLPDGGIYSTRTVAFAAYLGTNTDPTLTAKVQFPDPVGEPTGTPKIVAWNTHRR